MDGNVSFDVSFLPSLIFLLILAPTGSKSSAIIMCYKPNFFTENKCGTPTAVPKTLKASESISIDISKMPFEVDLWLHIDVMPSSSAIASKNTIKIKFAMLQITDADGKFLGRIAEQVPCNNELKKGGGHTYTSIQMSELYFNPGRKNIHVFECPTSKTLSYNVNPTVAVLEFKKAVEAFYINVKFTKTEMDFIQAKPNQIFITTILVDESGACHLHRLSKLDALPAKPLAYNMIVEVPIACHSVGQAFKDGTGATGPFSMDTSYKPTFSDLKFIDQSLVSPRPPSQMARILKELWKNAVYNHNLRVYNIDLNDPEADLGKDYTSVLRRDDVELIYILAGIAVKAEVHIDTDDDECDDKKRNRTTKDVDHSIKQLYKKCGYLIGCIGEPDDCILKRNCRVMIGWAITGDQILFEVVISERVYVAVGISKDARMGDDSVTECVREADQIYGYTSWNLDINGRKVNKRRTSCETMLEFEGGMETTRGSIMYCSWKRPVVTKVQGVTFDLNEPHYILLAEGDYSSSGVLGGLGIHDLKHVFSDEIILNDYFGKSPVEYWLAKIHGFFMLITWLLLVPVATFTVRYLKGTFTDRRLYRYKYTFWFGIHGTLVAATIFLTLTCVILLMAVDQHWIYEPGKFLSTHSILGFLISFLLFVQMGLAFGITKWPGKFKKFPLNFVHGVVGHVLVYCGFACVYTSKYERDGMDCKASYVMIGYLVIFLIIHAFMSYQVCFTDFLTGRETSRVYKVFLIDKPDDNEIDEPGSPARKIVFFVLIGILAIFNLYFVIMAFHPQALDCASKEALKPPTILTLGLL